VIIAQQAQPSCLSDDLVKEALGHIMLEQLAPILRKHRRIEAGLHQAHIQEPAKQQMVVDLLAEGALAPH
jgi:hypothetical protein